MANLATISNNILADSGIDPLSLIVGTGTVNYIPKFTGEDTLANSSLRTDSNGNIGVSVSPSSWGSASRAIQIGATAGLSLSSDGDDSSIATNGYRASNGDWIFINTSSYKPTRYTQYLGEHRWFVASASGSAGGVISFLQGMTLKTTRQLQLNAYGSGTFTGTVAYNLGVDSSGNIIEITDGGGTVTGTGTANQIAYWTGSSSIASLSTATYPSLTELSYVKGVTSAIQSQIDGKLSLSGGTMTGDITISGQRVKDLTTTNKGVYIGNWGGAGYWGLGSSATSHEVKIDQVSVNGVWEGATDVNLILGSNRTVLHSANYSSYALPLSGGTMTGQIIWTNISAPISFQNNGNTGTYTQTTIYANQNNTSGSNANGIFIERGYTDTSNTEVRHFVIGARGGTIQWQVDGTGYTTQYNSAEVKPSADGNFFIGRHSGSSSVLFRTYQSAGDGYLELRTGANAIVTKLSGYTGEPNYTLAKFGIGKSSSITYTLDVDGGSTNNYAASFVKQAYGAGYDGAIARFINNIAEGYSSYILIGSNPGTDWKIGKNISAPTTAAYNFEIVDSSNNLRMSINAVSGNTTFNGNVTANALIKSGGTSSQFLKADGSIDSNSYITGNQTITLTGDVTGSGTTSIATTIGAGKVTAAMLATFGSNDAINWAANTDTGFIKFVSSGDAAGESYLEIGTGDNGDEPIRFTQRSGAVTYTRVYIGTDGELTKGGGNYYVYASGATQNYVPLFESGLKSITSSKISQPDGNNVTINFADTYAQGGKFSYVSTYVSKLLLGRTGTGQTSNVDLIYDIEGQEYFQIKRNYSASQFRISRQGTLEFLINNSGQVIIGNTTGYAGLTISDFTANDGNDSLALFYRGTTGNHESLIKFYDFRGQVNAAIGNNLEDDGVGTQKARLVFKTAYNAAPAERARFTAIGYFGIATQSPFSLLHVGTRPGAGTTNPSLGSIATVSNDGLTGIDLGANVNANNVVGHINWVNYLGVGNYNTARIDVYASSATNSGSLRFWTASAASSPTVRLTIGPTGDATFTSSVTTNGNITIEKASPIIRLSGTAFGNSGAAIRFEGWASGSGYKNWQIDTAFTGSDELCFVPSTTAGGGTFTTPVFRVSSSGSGTFNSSLGIGRSPLQTLDVRGQAWINRPANKVDNASCTELPQRVEFNNAFVAGQSGYTVFSYPTYNVFRIWADYDGNIGGVQPDLQIGFNYLTVKSSGSYIGCVGVNTTSPLSRFEVKAAGDEDLIVGRYSGGSARIFRVYQSGADGYLELQTGAANVITKLSGYTGTPNYTLANWGIGTSSNINLRLIVDGGSTTGAAARIEKQASQGDGIVAYFVNSSNGGYSSYIYIGSNPGTDWKIGKNILNPTTTSYHFEIVDSSNNLRMRINNSTGAVTFSNTVTATGFFESSDSRIKELITDNYRAVGIHSIKPKLYKKDGNVELGYFAQDVESIMGHCVSKNDDGFLTLSYREVHTAKIAYLEDSIEEIKAKILYLENQLKTKQ